MRISPVVVDYPIFFVRAVREQPVSLLDRPVHDVCDAPVLLREAAGQVVTPPGAEVLLIRVVRLELEPLDPERML